MNITFYETLGRPGADPDCTILSTGTAELAVAQDTLLNAVAPQARCQIDGVDYQICGPDADSVWMGTINPDRRDQRSVEFAELRREDGQRSPPRIVLIKGHVARGEAICELSPSNETAAFDADGMVCFTQGCRILTAFGDLPVEHLRVGDLVHTVDHGLQPIRWIGARAVSRSRIDMAGHLCPVIIRRDSFGPGLPSNDIRVSQKHRILLETPEITQAFGEGGIFAPASVLAGEGTVLLDPAPKDTRYIHLLFDEHQVIFADGIPTESFYPCTNGLMSLTPQDRTEIFSIMPDLAEHPLRYGPCARPLLPSQLKQILAA
ncbi:Hint domain-containing protein [Neptunicoccus cionae]|uniref:Hedgehog/Intein (Hint) domain-containing protein n=1 Tax=Neptunicoccus cionae TaxID=2035344 RepID=A0A916QY39_9RHOB|nr:Hint domain-containing protein [Amylibacter cionae]GGA22756.1 hypothetical protein GCM10011498_24420 [Amylibacter cionae]